MLPRRNLVTASRHIRAAVAVVAAVGAFAVCGAANATIATVYDSVPTGIANFNTTVTGAGGTALSQQLDFNDAIYADFTISEAPSLGYGNLSGANVDIAPFGSTRGINNDARPSGVTFTFNSAVNAFGLEVGDWGTCCDPSGLYIAFDNGPAIQVGLYDGTNNTALTDGAFEIFVAAFDDSSSFTSVTFWGDGYGEYLVAGGTVRYALIDRGSLPPSGAIPEPTTWALMISGFGLAGGFLRRRRVTSVLAA